eukprot:Skav217658  [mRNA]  locus=scaffold2919:102915:103905:+ [translate_table: standard]
MMKPWHLVTVFVEALSIWERLLGPHHPADRIFDGADLDRDGYLDRKELAQSCGIMDMSGFNAIWEEINTEDSEAISREEILVFAQLLVEISPPKKREVLRSAA